ncbi:MAG TPA: zinc ribbon domain-containing protein [Terriglobales bacterium]|jgi:quinol-cytochrome oxidoreductase complex cytochrome b subunit|nr:zinc ribbon domain-containing protein [Terriglobales bacterium]
MQLKSDLRTQFTEELRIIPKWAYGVAVLLFVSVQILFATLVAIQKDTPSPAVRTLLGFFAGIIFGCYFLLIVYVNRDAARRGMNRALWTVIAVVITHGLGIILYLVLRQPLQSRCPQCEAMVQSGFNFCPKCNHQLNPTCPHCQHAVLGNDVYCAYCGATLLPPNAQPSSSSITTQQ